MRKLHLSSKYLYIPCPLPVPKASFSKGVPSGWEKELVGFIWNLNRINPLVDSNIGLRTVDLPLSTYLYFTSHTFSKT